MSNKNHNTATKYHFIDSFTIDSSFTTGTKHPQRVCNMSYGNLWKALDERGISKEELQAAAHLTNRAMEMLENGEPVRMAVACKIYNAIGYISGGIGELKSLQ